jgi:hypothetical protein
MFNPIWNGRYGCCHVLSWWNLLQNAELEDKVVVMKPRHAFIVGGITLIAFLALGERVLGFVTEFSLINYLGGAAIAVIFMVVIALMGFFDGIDLT